MEETTAKTGELEKIKNRVETEAKKAESDLNSCRSRLTSLEGLMENFEGYKAVRENHHAGEGFCPGFIRVGFWEYWRTLLKWIPFMNVPLKRSWPTNCNMCSQRQKKTPQQRSHISRRKPGGSAVLSPWKDLRYHTENPEAEPKFDYPCAILLPHPKEFEPLINSLLNNILLVDDNSRSP